MPRVYKLSDRVKIKIGGPDESFILTLSPLDRQQKHETQALLFESRRGKPEKAIEAIALALKYAVKNIEGLSDVDGNPYIPQFENGFLKEECVEDLLNMPDSNLVSFVASSWLNGVPKVFNDINGQPLPDVEIIDEKKKIAPTN